MFAWIRRMKAKVIAALIADDPNPEYSKLDMMDIMWPEYVRHNQTDDLDRDRTKAGESND